MERNALFKYQTITVLHSTFDKLLLKLSIAHLNCGHGDNLTRISHRRTKEQKNKKIKYELISPFLVFRNDNIFFFFFFLFLKTIKCSNKHHLTAMLYVHCIFILQLHRYNNNQNWRRKVIQTWCIRAQSWNKIYGFILTIFILDYFPHNFSFLNEFDYVCECVCVCIFQTFIRREKKFMIEKKEEKKTTWNARLTQAASLQSKHIK